VSASPPNYDAACFHAQQCIEKYLKAVLQRHEIPFRRIHDLEILLQACLEIFPLWQAMQDEMELLTQYAIYFRYPGESADKAEVKLAIDAFLILSSACICVRCAYTCPFVLRNRIYPV